MKPRNARSCGHATALFDALTVSFEPRGEESRHAIHHPVTRSGTPDVDVAVVRVAHKAESPAFEFPIKIVEYEVAEQGGQRSSLRSAVHAGADQPVLHHAGVQERPNESPQPAVFDALGDTAHQFVVVDAIEEFFQIEIDHPVVAVGDVVLRLGHGLMC